MRVGLAAAAEGCREKGANGWQAAAHDAPAHVLAASVASYLPAPPLSLVLLASFWASPWRRHWHHQHKPDSNGENAPRGDAATRAYYIAATKGRGYIRGGRGRPAGRSHGNLQGTCHITLLRSLRPSVARQVRRADHKSPGAGCSLVLFLHSPHRGRRSTGERQQLDRPQNRRS